jgi:hypothetical protein
MQAGTGLASKMKETGVGTLWIAVEILWIG